jgi:serine/threonine protein kinase
VREDHRRVQVVALPRGADRARRDMAGLAAARAALVFPPRDASSGFSSSASDGEGGGGGGTARRVGGGDASGGGGGTSASPGGGTALGLGRGTTGASGNMARGGHHPGRVGDTLKGGRYRILARLGSGHFSTVWLCLDEQRRAGGIGGASGYGSGRAGASAVAVKIQKSAARYTEAAYDEIRLLRAVRERDPDGVMPIVALLDSFPHEGPKGKHICLVFDVLGRSLLGLIRRFRHRGVPLPLVKTIAYNLLRGLDFLHASVGIIHTDLKPENILMLPSFEDYAIINREAAQYAAELISRKQALRRRPPPPAPALSLASQLPHDDHVGATGLQGYMLLTKNQRKRLKAKAKKASKRSLALDDAIHGNGIAMAAADDDRLLPSPPPRPETTSNDDSDSAAVPGEAGATATQPTARRKQGEDCANSRDDAEPSALGPAPFTTEGASNRTMPRGSASLDGQSHSDQEGNHMDRVEGDGVKERHLAMDHHENGTPSLYIEDAKIRSDVPSKGSAFCANQDAEIVGKTERNTPGVSVDALDGRGFVIGDFMDADAMYRRGEVKIIDLGNACWKDGMTSGVIQTRQYRSPEVIMGARFQSSADMWSVACLVFELATGEFLFDPHSGVDHGQEYDRDEDHLAQMIELLGPMPRAVSGKGVYARELFNRRGELRHIRQLSFWSLELVLREKYDMDGADAEELSDFLLGMLQFEPGRRATAAQCLEHGFLRGVAGSPDGLTLRGSGVGVGANIETVRL